MTTDAAVEVIAGADRRVLRNAGPPASGTSGTFVNKCVAGDLLMDTTNLVLYVNEGTSASPYWTPMKRSPQCSISSPPMPTPSR